MHSLLTTLFVLVGLARASVLTRATCPTVWTDVAKDLKSSFINSDGTCNDDARAAIRLSFHDCFPGACDGSIILANECGTRQENKQLIPICSKISAKATQYNTSVADMIQIGTAIGIASCPGGPRIQFLVGRPDSSTANPTNQIPAADAKASVTTAKFASKGFTSNDVVALVGAHSTAKNLNGIALDSTVSTWDVKFYSETAARSNPASLGSDLNLSNTTGTKETWANFAVNTRAWNVAFVSAMNKMNVLGNNAGSLVDCSSVINAAFS